MSAYRVNWDTTKGRPYGLQVQVHLARLVGKDPQAADLVGQFFGLGLGILWTDARRTRKPVPISPTVFPRRWRTEAEDTRLPLRA